jgi:ABC-type Fe3+/spermidine/putrescine transport system ATPase subunit
MGENNLLECVVENGGDGTYRVRLKDGSAATCVSDTSFRVGQQAILAMRPELASLQAAPRENVFAGKVTRALFMGDHWLIHVDTEAGPLLVKDTTNASGAAPGDTVSVSWSSRDSLLLPN